MSRFAIPLVAVVITATLLAAPVPLRAETLKVAVAETAYQNLPQVRGRILEALRQSGFEIELVALPGNRALLAASRGEVAIDVYRQRESIAQVPNLVAIEPPVDRVTFGMITSVDTPAHCDASEAQLGEMSVVGRLGIKLYEEYYYPRFARAESVSDFAQMLKLVAARRIDVSFLTEDAFARMAGAYRERLLFCRGHRKTFTIHSFIHRDFLWAKPRIEAAYRKAFGADR